MNKEDRRSNMFTGLGLVMAIMVGIILLPLIVPLITALVSIGATVLLACFLIWLLMLFMTAIGSMFNNARVGKCGAFNKDRVVNGKESLSSGREAIAKWLWGLSSKIAPKAEPDNTSGTMVCPACNGQRAVANPCATCNDEGTIPIPDTNEEE